MTAEVKRARTGGEMRMGGGRGDKVKLYFAVVEPSTVMRRVGPRWKSSLLHRRGCLIHL
jgi:ribosomal protein L16/L10AE